MKNVKTNRGKEIFEFYGSFERQDKLNLSHTNVANVKLHLNKDREVDWHNYDPLTGVVYIAGMEQYNEIVWNGRIDLEYDFEEVEDEK